MAFGVPAALAEYPTIDITAIKELGKQLAELKKQLTTQMESLGELKKSVSFLTDITSFTNDISDAVGKIASIKLRRINLDKIGAQTKSNLRCLLPDGPKWGIKTEDLSLSICESSSKYRQALFADGEVLKTKPWSEQQQARQATETRRTALLEDTALRAMSQADSAIKQADELDSQADKLQEDLDAAKTLQDRAQVSAQADVAKLRGIAQQTQILSQILKLQGAVAIMSGLPADKVNEIEKGEDK